MYKLENVSTSKIDLKNPYTCSPISNDLHSLAAVRLTSRDKKKASRVMLGCQAVGGRPGHGSCHGANAVQGWLR